MQEYPHHRTPSSVPIGQANNYLQQKHSVHKY